LGSHGDLITGQHCFAILRGGQQAGRCEVGRSKRRRRHYSGRGRSPRTGGARQQQQQQQHARPGHGDCAYILTSRLVRRRGGYDDGTEHLARSAAVTPRRPREAAAAV